MNRGAWQATVHGVAKSQTRLSTHTRTYTHTYMCIPDPPRCAPEADTIVVSFMSINYGSVRKRISASQCVGHVFKLFLCCQIIL